MAVKFPIENFQFKSDSILEGLSKDELNYLTSRMVEYKFKKGQNLFVEGSYPNGIFYLKKGKIKKYKSNREGKEQIIYICNEGELFGYPALLSEEPYHDSAAALEDAVVNFIPKNDFLFILNQSPELSRKLLINLSHEFGVLMNGIASFAHKTVRERLALSLLILKEKYRSKDDPAKPVEINLTREDLANIVGIAVETLVRLLHSLKDDGIIATSGRKIKILDVKKLIKIANYY